MLTFTKSEFEILKDSLQKAILDLESMQVANDFGDHYNHGFYCGRLWRDMSLINSIMDTAKKREQDNA
jgi:hypothetical protein